MEPTSLKVWLCFGGIMASLVLVVIGAVVLVRRLARRRAKDLEQGPVVKRSMRERRLNSDTVVPQSPPKAHLDDPAESPRMHFSIYRLPSATPSSCVMGSIRSTHSAWHSINQAN